MELGYESLRDKTSRPHPSSSNGSLSLIEGFRPPRPSRLALSQDLLSHCNATMQTQPPEVPWGQIFTFLRLQNMSHLMADCVLPCPVELFCFHMHSSRIVLHTVQISFAFINLFSWQTTKQQKTAISKLSSFLIVLEKMEWEFLHWLKCQYKRFPAWSDPFALQY